MGELAALAMPIAGFRGHYFYKRMGR